MRSLLLSDLDLALDHLLGQRRDQLKLLLCYPVYVPQLDDLRQQLSARLAGAPAAGSPFAAELASADARHDAVGSALFYMLTAYIKHPDTPEALRGQAERLLAVFIPSLAELAASYADEVARARALRPSLTAFADALRAFPTALHDTLYDWAAAMIAAGEEIDALLRRRADALSQAPEPPSTRTLRADVISQLSRLRGAMRDELRARPELPRDLEAQAFGFLDLLQSSRDAAHARQAAPAPASPPASEQP